MKQAVCLLVIAALIPVTSCRFGNGKPAGSGTIECTQVRLAPQVSGRISELIPQEGTVLEAGDAVARLDTADYELKRDEAKAAFAQASAQLDLARAGAREEDVQRAREQVREAKASADAAATDLKRIEQLFAQNSATRKQLDDSKAYAERTDAAAAAAGQSLQRLLKGNREEEVRLAAAALDLAKARLAQAEKAVADCTLKSPIDGTVTVRIHEPGEWVTAGIPVVIISNLDDAWLSVYVPENRIQGITIGQPARVRVDGRDGFFDGTVTFVASEAEFTPRNVQTPDERAKLVYRVKVGLPNPEGIFKPGMPADAFLDTGRK